MMQKYPIGLDGPEVAVFFDGNFWHWSYTAVFGDELMTYDSPTRYPDQITAMTAGFGHFNKMATASTMIAVIAMLRERGSINGQEAMNLERSLDSYIKKNF